jgi:hypothetical protein
MPKPPKLVQSSSGTASAFSIASTAAKDIATMVNINHVLNRETLADRLNAVAAMEPWVPDMVDFSKVPDIKRSLNYAKAYNASLFDLVHIVYDVEYNLDNPRLVKGDRRGILVALAEVAFSTSADIIAAILEGNLSQRLKDNNSQNDNLRKVMKDLKDDGLNPSINIHYIVETGTGKPMLISDARKAANMMLRYIKDDKIALDIDLIKGFVQKTKKASRRATMDERYYIPNASIQEKIEDFVAAFGEILDKMEVIAGQNGYMTRPLAETGYALKPDERKTQHEDHKATNHLIGLYHAVCMHLFPGKYTLQFHVVFNCWSARQCSDGEIFFTALAQSYHDWGLGFNHTAAGKHLGQLAKNTELTLKFWTELQRHFIQFGSFSQTCKNVAKVYDEIHTKSRSSNKEAEKTSADAIALRGRYYDGLDQILELLGNYNARMKERIEAGKFLDASLDRDVAGLARYKWLDSDDEDVSMEDVDNVEDEDEMALD